MTVVTETTTKHLFIRELLVVPLLLLIQMSSSSVSLGEKFFMDCDSHSNQIKNYIYLLFFSLEMKRIKRSEFKNYAMRRNPVVRIFVACLRRSSSSCGLHWIRSSNA